MKKPRTDAFDPNHALSSPLESLPPIETAKRPPNTSQSRPPASTQPTEQPAVKSATDDTTTPRHRYTTSPGAIEAVRRAVKEVGKEAATHRFTSSEKRALAAIVYTYATQNIRTSENEVARIAVNWLLQDYDELGKESMLHRVLHALNS